MYDRDSRGAGRGRFWAAALLWSTALLTVAAGSVERPAAAEEAAVIAFNIPAQPLDSALAAFGAAAGVQVLYDSSATASLTSTPVRGSFTAEEALRRLLAGTGVSYRFTGAASVTLTGGAFDATLAGDTLLLDPVTVTTTAAGDPADLPFQTLGSSTFISSEELQRFPITSVGDIFKSTSGVIAASNRNGGGLDINIRGLQGMNRVATTIDGIVQSTSVYRGYAGVSNRTYVDPDLLSGIMIGKGPSTGVEGAGAIGGVVSMRTIEAGDIVPDGKSWGVRLLGSLTNNAVTPEPGLQTERTSGSPFDLASGSGSVAAGLKFESFDVLLAFARRVSGNYFAGKHGSDSYRNYLGQEVPLSYTDYGEEVFNTSQDATTGLFKVNIRPSDEHAIQLSYSFYENEFGEVTPDLWNATRNVRQWNLNLVNVDSYAVRYRWNPQNNDWFDLRANAWASIIDEDAWYYGDTARKTHSEHYGIDLSNSTLLSTGFGEFLFNYGGSYSWEHTAPREFSRTYPPEGSREIGSLFLTTQWKPVDWLKLEGSLRYLTYEIRDENPYQMTYLGQPQKYPDQSGSDLAPTVGVTVIPLEGLQLYGLYTEGYRPPSIRESVYSFSGLWPNPDLKPERARNWELGINYLADDLVLANDAVRIKFAYFNNTYEDYIGRQIRIDRTQPGFGYLEVINLDAVKLSGFELTASYDAGFAFAEGSFTYYDNVEYCKTADSCGKATTQADYFANQVPPEFAITGTFGGRLLDGDLEFGTRISYVGPRAAPIVGPADYFFPITVTWEPYTLVDLFASWEVTEVVSLNVSVTNLTDRYYLDALNSSMNPSPGRTIQAGLSIQF